MLLDAAGRLTTSAKREIVIDNPRIAKFAAFADDVFKQLNLTVVCLTCGGTPTGNNAVTDERWKLECSCSVRILTNPERRAH